jgi:hypothetical protein
VSRGGQGRDLGYTGWDVRESPTSWGSGVIALPAQGSLGWVTALGFECRCSQGRGRPLPVWLGFWAPKLSAVPSGLSHTGDFTDPTQRRPRPWPWPSASLGTAGMRVVPGRVRGGGAETCGDPWLCAPQLGRSRARAHLGVALSLPWATSEARPPARGHRGSPGHPRSPRWGVGRERIASLKPRHRRDRGTTRRSVQRLIANSGQVSGRLITAVPIIYGFLANFRPDKKPTLLRSALQEIL